MIFEPGQIFADGAFCAESFIAEGRVAEVWRAKRISSGRIVAVKVLRPRLAESADDRRRFELEYELLERLRHRSIVGVRHFGELEAGSRGIPWFSMDYYPFTLEQRIDQLSIGEGVKALAEALGGLQHAHESKVIHRDFKPSNILMKVSGKAVLSDFGIAKDAAASKSHTGELRVASPLCFSPEQCVGKPVGPAGDIYSVGVVLYRICTGAFPFDGSDERSIIDGHMRRKPLAPGESNPALSESLAELILQCLAKEPGERVGSVQEVRDRLLRCREVAEAGLIMLDPGRKICEGRYQVGARIEQSSYTEVYRLKELKTGRRRALKIGHPQLAGAPTMLRRFLEEVKILERLDHPGIVEILETGMHPYHDTQFPFYVTPLYAGTFGQGLSRPFDPNKATEVLLQTLDALEYAHGLRKRVIHRDLRPANVLIGSDGRAVLIDFAATNIVADPAVELNHNATVTRRAFGSSYYRAPEQIKHDEIDARADIYAFGVMLYQVATGRPPFSARVREEVVAMHLYAEPPSPRQIASRVSRALESVIMKCLKKDPNERYGDVSELRSDLLDAATVGRWFETTEISPPAEPIEPRRRAGRLAAAMAAGLAAGWFATLVFRFLVTGPPVSGGEWLPTAQGVRRTVAPALRYRAAARDPGSEAARRLVAPLAERDI